MKQVGFTMSGHSEYADRLWSLLGRYEDVDEGAQTRPSGHPFSGIDYIALIPFLVLAGATVRPEQERIVVIEIPEDAEEQFYAELEGLLTSASRP